MGLKVYVDKRDNGVFVISPCGSIDSSTYLELDKTINPLLAASTKGFIFNMEHLDYISSLGIGVVLKAKKVMEGQKATFIMTNLKPQIKLAFEIIKALPSMRIFESIEEADEYLFAMQKKEIEKQKDKG